MNKGNKGAQNKRNKKILKKNIPEAKQAPESSL